MVRGRGSEWVIGLGCWLCEAMKGHDTPNHMQPLSMVASSRATQMDTARLSGMSSQ